MFGYRSTHESSVSVVVLGQWDVQQRIRQVLSSYSIYSVRGDRQLQRGLVDIDEHGADVVIIDGTSAKLDPIQACLDLRNRKVLRQVPVLVATDHARRPVRRLARYVGCTDFLELPVDEVELTVRISNYVDAMMTTERLQGQVADLLLDLRSHHAHMSRLGQDLSSANVDLLRSHEITIQRLAHATELRDDSTGEHTRRVSAYCAMLASCYGLKDDTVERFRIASPLHDVGKIGIPDHILFKPGRLTPSEYDVVKLHPKHGHDMLTGTDSYLLNTAASIALTHHEKWDGSGYPLGLQGEDIPLEGRMTAIADVFDALTSARCYKRAYTVDESLSIMRRGRSTHFDPDMLDLFIDRLPSAHPIQSPSLLN